MKDNRELRAAADKMLELLERIRLIEGRKASEVQVGSDEFVQLAEQSERVARVIFRWSQLQLELAYQRPRGGTAGAAATLTQVEPRRLDRILAEWREAQLRLEGAPLGSAEAEAAANDVERLRLEYGKAQQDRMNRNSP